MLDFQDIDGNSGPGETKELRQSRGEVGAGGEGIKGLRGNGARLGSSVAILIGELWSSKSMIGGKCLQSELEIGPGRIARGELDGG